MCVDFANPNEVTLKDDFYDGHAGHAQLSFMGGYVGYNQVMMAEEDLERTTFITPWGT